MIYEKIQRWGYLLPTTGTVLSILVLWSPPTSAAIALLTLITLKITMIENSKFKTILQSICIMMVAIQMLLMLSLFPFHITVQASPVS